MSDKRKSTKTYNNVPEYESETKMHTEKKKQYWNKTKQTSTNNLLLRGNLSLRRHQVNRKQFVSNTANRGVSTTENRGLEEGEQQRALHPTHNDTYGFSHLVDRRAANHLNAICVSWPSPPMIMSDTTRYGYECACSTWRIRISLFIGAFLLIVVRTIIEWKMHTKVRHSL